MTELLHAPRGTRLRVVDIAGGHHVRRRLVSLGIHPGDILELRSQGILNGPFLVRLDSSGSFIALGRGVAHKILVEAVDGP